MCVCGLYVMHPVYFAYSYIDTNKQCVMFFGLQVDRGNLVQAVSDNLLDDLNLSTNGNPWSRVALS